METMKVIHQYRLCRRLLVPFLSEQTKLRGNSCVRDAPAVCAGCSRQSCGASYKRLGRLVEPLKRMMEEQLLPGGAAPPSEV